MTNARRATILTAVVVVGLLTAAGGPGPLDEPTAKPHTAQPAVKPLFYSPTLTANATPSTLLTAVPPAPTSLGVPPTATVVPTTVAIPKSRSVLTGSNALTHSVLVEPRPSPAAGARTPAVGDPAARVAVAVPVSAPAPLDRTSADALGDFVDAVITVFVSNGGPGQNAGLLIGNGGAGLLLGNGGNGASSARSGNGGNGGNAGLLRNGGTGGLGGLSSEIGGPANSGGGATGGNGGLLVGNGGRRGNGGIAIAGVWSQARAGMAAREARQSARSVRQRVAMAGPEAIRVRVPWEAMAATMVVRWVPPILARVPGALGARG